MSKLNNFIKSRVFIITITLTFIVLIIAGVTYAWFTWTSTDNTNITMQIGESTIVTFTGGNAINVNNLTPVYSYTNEPSTTFSLTNNNTDALKVFKYNVYLDITSIANELVSTSLKYVLLDGSSNVVDQGNFSTASNGYTLTITEDQTLPNGTSSYTFIIYLDGNEYSNPNMMNKSLTGSLRVTAVKIDVSLTWDWNIVESNANPITDYEYTLYDKEDTGLGFDYVLLSKYIGSSETVVIPSFYTVDGVKYKTALYIEGAPTGTPWCTSTFKANTTIISVTFPQYYFVYFYSEYNLDYGGISRKPGFYNTVMSHMFSDCTSLVNAPIIPNSVTHMDYTFSGCTSLVNAPTIPSSVTHMAATFSGCASLVTAPTIPNSVTYMSGTFLGCTSLVNAPQIPSSVTNMNGTFSGCTSLVNAPTIPNSVTNMAGTFRGCTNLTGTVRINSSEVWGDQNNSCWNNAQHGDHPFYNTAKPITVEVPAGSTTYTNINTKLPANVTITTFTP